MVTIGPMVLFCLLGVTFCVGLKKHHTSPRHVISRRKTILVADGSSGRVGNNPDAGGSSATGSGGTADAASKTTQPSLVADSPSSTASLRQAHAIPEGVETNEGDESDGQQVRGGLEVGGRAESGREESVQTCRCWRLLCSFVKLCSDSVLFLATPSLVDL